MIVKDYGLLLINLFFKTSSYVECTNCNKRTKSFIRIDKAIQEWNNKCDGILQEKIYDKVEHIDARWVNGLYG